VVKTRRPLAPPGAATSDCVRGLNLDGLDLHARDWTSFGQIFLADWAVTGCNYAKVTRHGNCWHSIVCFEDCIWSLVHRRHIIGTPYPSHVVMYCIYHVIYFLLCSLYLNCCYIFCLSFDVMLYLLKLMFNYLSYTCDLMRNEIQHKYWQGYENTQQEAIARIELNNKN